MASSGSAIARKLILSENAPIKMTYLRNCFALVLMAAGSMVFAQSPEVFIRNPEPPRVVGRFLKPFHLEKRIVAPARLTNSPRLESLVRSGNLYLSAQDVIALALENNLDIAVQRYSPFLAREVLRRAQGGGQLRARVMVAGAGCRPRSRVRPAAAHSVAVGADARGADTGWSRRHRRVYRTQQAAALGAPQNLPRQEWAVTLHRDIQIILERQGDHVLRRQIEVAAAHQGFKPRRVGQPGRRHNPLLQMKRFQKTPHNPRGFRIPDENFGDCAKTMEPAAIKTRAKQFRR